MNDQELQKEIKAAVAKLGIDVPIMSTRVVGNRLELTLYGGASTSYLMVPTQAAPSVRATTHAPDEPIDLTALSKSQLLAMAKREEIPGRSKMTKPQLIQAIQRTLS